MIEIKDKNDITIHVANGSRANFGIFIVGNSRNVVARNMTIGLLPDGEAADSITIEGRGTDRNPEQIWIDHNTISPRSQTAREQVTPASMVASTSSAVPASSPCPTTTCTPTRRSP